jgi:hypothetical protein
MMKSIVTNKEYDIVPYVHVDTESLVLKSIEGVSFKELEDNTWLCLDGEHKNALRYRGTAYHGGGIYLAPIFELVDGNWVWILTGKPAPPAVIKVKSK